ncbi:helix-turn-helix domain-containing protein [Shouchella clausii]|jgi:transcriptional regulator with XRE-family HTH domain|uniref:helix-turn-helix domain-containing protein n=1 Tax=Shouchella clausii TaxID=79880 RepID=UPI000B96A01D|nr:helix-turn-helix transcriptional regulator [Shouchella clausii]AST97926.1 transcriptional regulator [Shouchella clausii]MCR1289279.1 helix-turn-helix domain-containing protein [Shouchella clausii]MEB5475371.1 helix-turn-helix transcriptional regulator [Shouchella clausii]QNM44369.1 XRE family transcriptional regulator [Shouchella clausii]WQG96937.1 helix-turn-helix transcriptional regulator [Shouchella clausii]
MTIVPERLKALRKERQLTQEQLGELINVTKVSISGYENGNRTPDTDTLRRLADVFGVSTDYLLGRSKEKNGSFFYDNELTHKEAQLLREHLAFIRFRANKKESETD